MEKDIDRIQKNADTDIIIRVDDFGGRRGITIREFVRGERYTGFTKAGTRIPAEHFKAFKQAINSIDEKELMETAIGDAGMQKNLNSMGGMQKIEESGNGKQAAVAGTGKPDAKKHSADKEKVKAKPRVEEDIGEEEF